MDLAQSAEPIDLSVLARKAMLERGLEPDFPAAAIEQDERLTVPAQDRDLTGQTDLLWFSIDDDESRDLDQLTFAERIDRGAVRIRVAVADVDALVRKGTPVDDHARYESLPDASRAVINEPDIAESRRESRGGDRIIHCAR
jgi:exoribonuclease II